MATGLGMQLTRQIGEHLVTAELGRRGIIATPFAGNVPDIDLLAYANGISIGIQVKAINKGAWQFDIRRFLDIELLVDRQKVLGPRKGLDRNLMCIFMAVGESIGKDEFFIFQQGWLQDYFKKAFPGRKTPAKIESYHCAIFKEDMLRHRDKWERIEKKLKL